MISKDTSLHTSHHSTLITLSNGGAKLDAAVLSRGHSRAVRCLRRWPLGLSGVYRPGPTKRKAPGSRLGDRKSIGSARRRVRAIFLAAYHAVKVIGTLKAADQIF